MSSTVTVHLTFALGINIIDYAAEYGLAPTRDAVAEHASSSFYAADLIPPHLEGIVRVTYRAELAPRRIRAMSATASLAPGTPVTYQGSVESLHGPATFIGPCLCDHDPCADDPAPRYELRHTISGRSLDHVRSGSFTPDA